tara:strand:- start:330 stop:1364 length:1035 start_codon:yes stop_codon:yes gene_type:complete
MKIVYYITPNSSHFSFLYNIYKLLPGPLYCTFGKSNISTYINESYRILETIEELNEYNPDFVLFTEFYDLKGNWKNIYIGHGYGYDIFKNNCNESILTYDEYTKNGLINYNYNFNYIFVPSELVKQDINKLCKISLDKIKVIGVPRFDNIKNVYFVNYNNKKSLVYAPSWRDVSSLNSNIATENIIKLSDIYNIFVIFHPNILLGDSFRNIENAKKLIDNKSNKLKIIYRNDYKSIFEGYDNKYIITLHQDENDMLQNLINSTDFLLCDEASGVSWDALYLQKPYLQLNESYNIEFNNFLNTINSTSAKNNFIYCGKEYNLEDIFGKNDKKNSKRCIDILKELI